MNNLSPERIAELLARLPNQTEPGLAIELTAAFNEAFVLQQELQTAKSEALRWEKPAARWRKMRKAVEALVDAFSSEAAKGALRNAMAVIDRVAGEDIPDTDELALLRADVRQWAASNDELMRVHLIEKSQFADEVASLKAEVARLTALVHPAKCWRCRHPLACHYGTGCCVAARTSSACDCPLTKTELLAALIASKEPTQAEVSQTKVVESIREAIAGLITVQEGMTDLNECYFEVQFIGRTLWAQGGKHSVIPKLAEQIAAQIRTEALAIIDSTKSE